MNKVSIIERFAADAINAPATITGGKSCKKSKSKSSKSKSKKSCKSKSSKSKSRKSKSRNSCKPKKPLCW